MVSSNTPDKKARPDLVLTAFAALAFRDPFSTTTSNALPQEHELDPLQNRHSISPKSTPASELVSTIPSNATTPGSEDIEKQVLQHAAVKPVETRSSTPSNKVTRPRSSSSPFFRSPAKDTTPKPRNNRWTDNSSYDGGMDSMQRNISTERRPRLTPMRLSSSPMSYPRADSLSESYKSVASSMTEVNEDCIWELDDVRKLTDEVRASIKSDGSIPEKNIELVEEIISSLLEDEQSSDPTTEIEAIGSTRLDKLLKDIARISTHREIYTKATALARKWQQRFQGVYYKLDERRMDELRSTGALHDMTLAQRGRDEDKPVWNCSRVKSSDLEGGMLFQPGDWWLNLYCAYRDGAVGQVDNIITKGKNGIIAIALLAGEEEVGPKLHTFEYSRVGTFRDMLFPLLGCKRPIRVLRGSNLKSKFAPRAGVRYDGLFVVKEFGHKLLDEANDIYRNTITLERLPDQKSMEEVLKRPKPAQLDDWILYNQLIGEDFRLRRGDRAYTKWKEFEEDQQAEKEQYVKARKLREGFRKYNMDADKSTIRKVSGSKPKGGGAILVD